MNREEWIEKFEGWLKELEKENRRDGLFLLEIKDLKKIIELLKEKGVA